jgi:hypothetical protein
MKIPPVAEVSLRHLKQKTEKFFVLNPVIFHPGISVTLVANKGWRIKDAAVLYGPLVLKWFVASCRSGLEKRAKPSRSKVQKGQRVPD